MNAPANSNPCIETTCPYCGVGCGVKIEMAGRESKVVPSKTHPANQGRLCSKGTALASTLGLSDRLLIPKIRNQEGEWEQSNWDEALGKVADKFHEVIEKYGPDAVAFYVSGQLLTEDYYAINKLAKGLIGTANIDTNSRLCMASAVAAHKKAFGADLVPAIYDDLSEAEVLIFSGHNAAWTHPVLMRQIENVKNQYRIAIDPRRTETAKSADLHLMIAPQSDVRLWNGLCHYLIENGEIDGDFINKHTNGICELKKELEKHNQSLASIAKDCGISKTDLLTFYQKFTDKPKVVSLFSQGSNQSSQGVNKGLALINAHLISGKIGKKGAAPFSITGQPNAMGGREVGGLANTLAAHMDFDKADLVQRFWQTPNIAKKAGLKAVEMFNAIEEGKIKAIWIMATNPMVSMPNTNQIERALKKCEMVVVSDVVEHNDTLSYAHIALPAAAWGEKDGTVTNSERMISRQRGFINNSNVKPDWRIIRDFAHRLSPELSCLFAWENAAQIFDEYAKLTAFENDGRFLNLSGLVDLNEDEYDELKPIRWPVLIKGKSSERLFVNGKFQTADGKAIINIVSQQNPADARDGSYPFALNTTRIRDQWHTMTRTATSYRLNGHIKEPYVEIHPESAEKLGIKDEGLARIKTKYGQAIMRAQITQDVRKNCLNVPMHFTRNFAPFGRSNQIVNPFVDPISGQPEFKHTPAYIESYGEKYHGFLLLEKEFELWKNPPWDEEVIWRRISLEKTDIYEMASHKNHFKIEEFFDSEDLILEDKNLQITRRAKIKNGKLQAVSYIAPIDHKLPARDFLVACFAKEEIDTNTRIAILLGKLVGAKNNGALICACNSIFENQITEAILDGCKSIDAIGFRTNAGMSCGSCKSEIGRILSKQSETTEAEYAK